MADRDESAAWRREIEELYGGWLDLDYGFRVGDGWSGIVRGLLDRIAEFTGGPEAFPQIHIFEIKEKYGELRIYMSDVEGEHAEAVGIAVARAVGLSRITCETCGRPGRLIQSGGWWHVACHEHEDREGGG
jgi:hypothetical protein